MSVTEKDKKEEQFKLLRSELRIDKNEFKVLRKKFEKIYDRSERGVETMFRLTSKNHYTLNTMVDRKAGILISINSIILSLIIGTVLTKLSEDPHLVYPSIVILTTNILSIGYSVFATRPVRTHGSHSNEDVKNKTGNLLYYGNFHNMSIEEYENAIEEVMNDSDYLYKSITRDIYYIGQSLDKKMSFIRISFNIFLFGIAASVVAFLGCHWLFSLQ